MLLTNASAATSAGWRPSADPRDDGLVLLSGRLLVLGDGLVASLAPPHALFDLGRVLPTSSGRLLEWGQLHVGDGLQWVHDRAASASAHWLGRVGNRTGRSTGFTRARKQLHPAAAQSAIAPPRPSFC